MPTADDLFRSTGEQGAPAEGKPQGLPRRVQAVPDATEEDAGNRAASGRIRHDEKMTVYVTSDELLDIEQARLTLRGKHGLAVDRGRLVREAVALILHDLDESGADSMLVRRLTEE